MPSAFKAKDFNGGLFPVEHLFSTMLQQQEQHGGKQGSPNGGDQSLLARIVALEQEKREAALRA